MTRQYFVYILTNRYNSVLYTGVTHDLSGRVWQHKEGQIEGFTKRYKVNKLVYYEEFENIEEGILREKQIKGWLRKKKVAIIEVENKTWEDLSLGWIVDQPVK